MIGLNFKVTGQATGVTIWGPGAKPLATGGQRGDRGGAPTPGDFLFFFFKK